MPRSVRISEDKSQAIRIAYDQGTSMIALVRDFGFSQPIIRREIIRQGGVIRPKGRPPLTSPPSVLQAKLTTLSMLLRKPKQLAPEKINPDVLKTIVDYALRHNDGRTFRKIDRRYQYGQKLSEFRREFLESSYYVMGRLWRAVYHNIQQKQLGKKSDADDFGVAACDVKLCLSVLEVSDLAKILEWLDKTGPYMYLPNEVGVARVVADCEKTMKGIVNSKLRFIYQYDPAYEPEDLVSYLRVIAYRVAVKYDWEMEDGEFAYAKSLNFTKRSLWNAAFLLIKKNTGDDYKRLENVGTEGREYQITTVSMSVDGNRVAVEELLGKGPDISMETKDLVQSLDDSKLDVFLKLESEDNPAFNAYVLATVRIDENDLYNDDYPKWRELAQRFSGLMKKSDRIRHKREILKALRGWNRIPAGRHV